MGESIPVQLGRFRVDRFLGKGGMGAVYEAFDPKLRRQVALKTIRLDGEKDRALIDRLYREAQACARLRHPAIVTVHDVVEADGVVFIVMEYLEGTSLSQIIRVSGLSLDVRLGILVQLLDALDYAHGEGVVHRDIKPSNVHLLPDRRSVKLLDFGIAHVQQAMPLTIAGTVMGTPHYMSPEQLKGDSVDLRTDIYSASVLGYELLTQRRPFDGESVSEVVFKVANEPPPPMKLIWTSAPPELAGIIARGLAKSPDDRFHSAREMANEIRTVAQRIPPGTLRDDGGDRAELAVASLPSEATVKRDSLLGVPHRIQTRRRTAVAVTLAVALAMVVAFALWVAGASTRSRAKAHFEEQVTPAAHTGKVEIARPDDTAHVDGSTPDSLNGSQGRTREQASTDSKDSTQRGKGTPSAESLFHSGRQAVPHGFGKSGIKYQIIQIPTEGTEVAVDPEKQTFRKGDQIRLAFEANIDGYLYIVQKGSSGKWDVLFPRPDINLGSNRVQRFHEYLLPPPDSDWAIGFDPHPGTEHLFVFLSKSPVHELPGFEQPLKETATLAQVDVDHLAGHVQARDLVWEKKTTASSTPHGPSGSVTYVVNQSQFGDAVKATIDLTHR